MDVALPVVNVPGVRPGAKTPATRRHQQDVTV